MSTSRKPAALEGYVKMLVINIAGSIKQMRSGTFPDYNGNCRRAIREDLLQLAAACDQGNPAPGVGCVEIDGLQEHDLPPDMTLAELRRVRRFVLVPVPAHTTAPEGKEAKCP